MMKKATREQTRTHNSQLVLKTLYEQSGLSRADLARVTRLTRPTVSAIVGDLITEHLVSETGTGPSAGGKPPILLAVNADAYRTLCIDIGNREFRGALVDLRGNVRQRLALPGAGKKGETALQVVYELVEKLLATSAAPLLGLGIGTPGLVNPHAGIVRQAVNLDWQELRLRELLESRFDLPVYVANDSQAAALGEAVFGVGRDSHNLILVKVGQGIGAGIVLNGQPFYGDGFSAGEIGHVVVADNGQLCTCGNVGCLETVASTRAIEQQAWLLRPREPQQAGGDPWQLLLDAQQAGLPAAQTVVETAGRALGTATAHLIAAFNIHQLVFSGRITQLGEPLLQAVKAAARRRGLPALVDETTLNFSALGSDGVMLGASALVLKHELGIV